MNQPKEVTWERMFALPIPERAHTKNPHECSEACLQAKEIKCTCTACRGARHGAHLKKDVKRLDEFDGDEGESEDSEESENAGRYIA